MDKWRRPNIPQNSYQAEQCLIRLLIPKSLTPFLVLIYKSSSFSFSTKIFIRFLLYQFISSLSDQIRLLILSYLHSIYKELQIILFISTCRNQLSRVQMKYPTESALENHFLDSILPNTSYRQTKHVTKTKDFYQPDKFIWNIPHRTSSRMYPYYHKFNDSYALYRQPLIKQLQQNDRKQKEESRIIRLLELKNQTRQRFFDFKSKRQDLQNRCFSQTRNYSTLQTGVTLNKLQPFNQNITQKSQTNIPNGVKSHRIMRIQQTYSEAVMKSQKKLGQIQQMVLQQRKTNRFKIRNAFSQKKSTNDQSQSKLKKFTTLSSMRREN